MEVKIKKFSHTTADGMVNMVSILKKQPSLRTASAYGEVYLNRETFLLLRKNALKKGDVLTIAKIAGIQAAKKTSALIPLCHNILISKIDISIKLNIKKSLVEITSYAETNAATGIEMEALTAVSVAALTVYDMCKAISKNITISNISLLSKTGGKSGNYNKINK